MAITADRKYGNVLRTIRGRIVKGVYLRSHRLPTWSELGEEFGVGVGTVQRAIDRLVDDGFVTLKARKGTFVAESPPHLCNYGVVIPQLERWSRYYMALQGAVESTRTDSIRFKEYYISQDVGPHGDMARLCSDVRNHRLAGLILVGSRPNIEVFEGTPVLDEPGTARVLIEDLPEFGLPVVATSESSFMDKSVEYLFSKNRRRIAHLRMDFSWENLEEFERNLNERGVETQPYWILPIPAGTIFRGVAHLVNMMMQMERDKRPDALIIHDDNLVEHTAAGLMAAGMKVPDDIEVVAMCNFPAPVPTMVPIKHLGYDVRLILKKCLQVLSMQQDGRTAPVMTRIPAMFESELAAEV